MIAVVWTWLRLRNRHQRKWEVTVPRRPGSGYWSVPFSARVRHIIVHDLLSLGAVGGLPRVTPKAQSDTDLLRARYGRPVDDGRARRVRAWCDWVDQVLGDIAPVNLVVHGDLHGYNQLWDFDAGALVALELRAMRSG